MFVDQTVHECLWTVHEHFVTVEPTQRPGVVRHLPGALPGVRGLRGDLRRVWGLRRGVAQGYPSDREHMDH